MTAPYTSSSLVILVLSFFTHFSLLADKISMEQQCELLKKCKMRAALHVCGIDAMGMDLPLQQSLKLREALKRSSRFVKIYRIITSMHSVTRAH